jgi:hypothetical protein
MTLNVTVYNSFSSYFQQYTINRTELYEKDTVVSTSVADAAPDPAPGEHFDAAPDPAAPAPAPTLLYSKAKFLKRTKVETISFI